MAEMESIIYVCPAIFLERKRDTVFHKNEKLAKKIATLIEGHRCFKEENISYQSQNTWQHNKGGTNHHTRHPNGNKNHRHMNVKRPPVSSTRRTFIGVETNKVIREATSILNKISPKNIGTLFPRFFIMYKQNPDHYLHLNEAVLKKCIDQECFTQLYMRILASLKAEHNEITENVCYAFIDDFKTSLVSELNALSELDTNKSGYDAMCEFFKRKARLLSKNRCIMRLVNDNIINIDLNNHVDFLIMLLQRPDATSVELAIVSQAMADSIKVIVCDERIMNNLQTIFNDIITPVCGMSTRFLWLDMIESLKK